jgi:hypothetical protein
MKNIFTYISTFFFSLFLENDLLKGENHLRKKRIFNLKLVVFFFFNFEGIAMTSMVKKILPKINKKKIKSILTEKTLYNEVGRRIPNS